MDTLYRHVFSANYDRGFLEGVKGSFRTVGFDWDIINALLLVFGLVAVLYLLGRAFNEIRARLRNRDIPAHWIVKKPEIRRILQQALDQRSKFEMKFLPSDYARPVAVCSLIDFDDASLSFEIGRDVQATKRWMEKTAEFFFSLRGPKKNQIFYRFTGPIVGIKRLPDNVSSLLIAYPDKIELQQKRAFLRLEPPPQYLLGCALWLDKGQPMPENVKKWGRPKLMLQPGKAANPLSVQDISAGGLRLLLTRSAIKTLGTELGIANNLYLMLDLYDPEVARKRRFWLQCRIQHVFEDFESRDVEYGAQFMASGRLSKQDEEGNELSIKWTPVEEDGVELLGGWVMKRHLELYRDKGIV